MDRVHFISCKHGILYKDSEKEVVICDNHKCRDKYCEYGHFTGGQIPDSMCPYFEPKDKKDKKEYHI